jgi:hypothetical protein
MMRMYYKTILTSVDDGGKVLTDDNKNLPYTTGRSISDIIEQVRMYIPNMQ